MTKPIGPIGKIILKRLSDLEKTQGWLAEQAGVSDTAVHKWIHNGQISREKAAEVAIVLGVSVDTLLGMGNEKTTEQPVVDRFALHYVTAIEAELLQHYREANTDGKRTIIAVARGADKDRAVTNMKTNGKDLIK